MATRKRSVSSEVVLPLEEESTPPFVAPGVLESPIALTRSVKVTCFVEPDDGRSPFKKIFEKAETSIDIFLFVLGDKKVASYLTRAVERGVRVRALLEPCPHGNQCEEPNDVALSACQRLHDAGVLLKWANPAFSKTHAKAAVIDGRRALITTINLDKTLGSRRDYGLITNDPSVVDDLSRVFAQDWEFDKPESGCWAAPIDRSANDAVQQYDSGLVVSPDNARSKLLEFIRSAESSLLVHMEKIDSTDTDSEIVPAIADAAARGVHVQVLMRPPDNEEHASNFDVAKALKASGAKVCFQEEPQCHAKMMLVDRRVAFVGSQNLTASSLDKRREIGWITDDERATEVLERIFHQDWADGRGLYAHGPHA